MKNLYLFLVLAFASSASAQTNALNAMQKSASQIMLHTNATSFVAGETLYYKIYLPLVKETPDDTISYIVLVGQDKSAVFIHKHFLSDRMTFGDFFIPSTIETGSYKLIAYTKGTAKSHTQIAANDILIINPFQNSNKNTDVAELVIGNAQMQSPYALNLIPKQNFKTRELVKLNSANLPSGNYSVSVRKMDDLDLAAPTANSKSMQVNQPNGERSAIVAELRGEIISGQVTSKNQSGSKLNLALSIPGENPIFKVVKTDGEGRFTFTVEQINPSAQVYLQVIGKNQQDFSISVDKAPMPDFANLSFPAFKVPEVLEKDLRERMVAVQVRNAYLGKIADTIVPPALGKMFYEPISKDYILDKYTRFPTFAQNIVELMPEVYYLKKGNQFTVHVRDNNIGRTIPEPTLLLVDGILLQDASELFSYPMKDVEKISVVTGIYLYGPTAFNGLLSVTTKSKNYEAKSVKPISDNIIRPFPEKKYYRQHHNEATKRLPDFRQQLLWLPQMKKNDSISFYTSDLSGTFKVEISGLTDAGQPFSISANFEVVE